MYVFVDNSERDFDKFILFDKEKIIAESKIKKKSNTGVLNNFDVFLRKNKLKAKQIKGLVTVGGVGSFTSSRVASLLANGFFYTFGIPVFVLGSDEKFDYKKMSSSFKNKKNKFLLPEYSGKPNIGTVAKSNSWKKIIFNNKTKC